MYVAQRGRRTRWQSNYTLSVRHAPLCSEFSLGLAFELDALGVVHKAVEDGICQSRVWDAQVPVRDRYLGSDEGGGMPEAIVENFKDILGILNGDGVAQPVVEDEQVDLCQGAQQAGVRAIASTGLSASLASLGQGMEQAGDAVVTDGKSAAGCCRAKGAGDESLAAAGGTKHKEVVAAGDPIAQAEFEDGAPVEAAGGGEVEIFESGLHGESGGVDIAADAVLASLGALVVHEQGQAVFEGEFGVFGVGLLLAQSFAEGGQAQCEQLVVEGLQGHGKLLCG